MRFTKHPLVLLALVARVFIFAQDAYFHWGILSEISGDEIGYLERAREIAATGRLPALTFQPHGQSVLLAPIARLIPDHVMPVQFGLTILLDAMLLWHLSHLALNRIGNASPFRRHFVVAILLVQPFTAVQLFLLLTEPWVTVFTYVGTWLLACWLANSALMSYLAFASFSYGLAVLLRTETLVVYPALLASTLVLSSRLTGIVSRLRSLAWSGIVSAVAFLTPLAAICSWQYASTGDFAFITLSKSRPSGMVDYSGYYSWVRTWMWHPVPFTEYAWGMQHDSTWESIETRGYPDDAYDSMEEQRRVEELIHEIVAHGYAAHVDGEFAELGRLRRTSHPIRMFLVLPAQRMWALWWNVGGEQVWRRASHVHGHEPFRTILGVMALALKIALLILAVIGFGGCLVQVRQATSFRSDDFTGEQRQESSVIDTFALASGCAIVLRTSLFGALGTMIHGGLCEPRYMIPLYPFVLYLAVYSLLLWPPWQRAEPHVRP